MTKTVAGKKYYVVWKGAIPGVYGSWEECTRQIRGFPGALYKSFPDLKTAEAAFSKGPLSFISKKNSAPQPHPPGRGPVRESLSVDGAWNTATGDMEYQGVYTKTGAVWFRQGPYADGTNNIGEFLAIVHALALLKRQKNTMPVYSDSHTALTWVRKKSANTRLQKTERNSVLFELLARAENWLRENSFENPLLKWETSFWGEIPADFGRK